LKRTVLEIRKTEGFGIGIKRLLGALHDESARYITARSRQHISVHEFRKNIKKIRAILRLVRSGTGKDSFRELNKKYSRIANQVALLRDDTSQIELLDKMHAEVNDPRVQYILRKARRQLVKKRQLEFTVFYQAQHHTIIREAILEMKEKALGIEIKGEPEGFILKDLHRTYRQCREEAQVPGLLYEAGSYHDWRKQEKYLMYQMMILRNIEPDYFREYIGELNKLSDYLGNLHDLDLFKQHIHEAKLLVLSPEQKRIVLKHIYRKRSSLRKKIRLSAEKLFQEDSQDFAARVYGFLNP